MMHNPPHPGESLAYYMEGRSVTDVAAHIGDPSGTLPHIEPTGCHFGRIGNPAGKAFGADPSIPKLQMQRDLWAASRKKPKVTRLAAKLAA